MCFEIHLRSSQTPQNQKKSLGAYSAPGPQAEILARCARTEVEHKCTLAPLPHFQNNMTPLDRGLNREIC